MKKNRKIENYFLYKYKDTTFNILLASGILYIIANIIMLFNSKFTTIINYKLLDNYNINYYIPIILYYFTINFFNSNENLIKKRNNILNNGMQILIIFFIFAIAFKDNFKIETKDFQENDFKSIILFIAFLSSQSFIYAILSKKYSAFIFIFSLMSVFQGLYSVWFSSIPLLLYAAVVIKFIIDLYANAKLLTFKLIILLSGSLFSFIKSYLFKRVKTKKDDNIKNAIRIFKINMIGNKGYYVVNNKLCQDKNKSRPFIKFFKDDKNGKGISNIWIFFMILQIFAMILTFFYGEYPNAELINKINIIDIIFMFVYLIVSTFFISFIKSIIKPKLGLTIILISLLLQNPIINLVLLPVLLNILFTLNLKSINLYDLLIDFVIVILSYYMINELLIFNHALKELTIK